MQPKTSTRERELHHAIASLRDGTSNTLLLSEVCIGVDNARINQPVKGGYAGGTPGGYWFPPSDCMNRRGPNGRLNGTTGSAHSGGIKTLQGRVWASGYGSWGRFHAALPPNSPTCGSENAKEWAPIISASSYHTGGVNAALCDGSVTFFSETINCNLITVSYDTYMGANGYTKPSGKSPYGVWGALGTRDGAESVTAF